MSTESRVYPRKVLRCQAQLQFRGIPPLGARTIDISMGGACLMVREPLPTGHTCMLAFETMVSGRICRLNAPAKVVYSILNGTEGFRTGLQFTQLDAANAKVLGELMA